MYTFKKEYLRYIAVLIPFLFIYIGTSFQNTNASLSSLLKMVGFFYMIIYTILTNRINFNLIKGMLVLTPFLIYGILHTFNYIAGISDTIRYLFPIVTLFYSFAIRKYLNVLIYFVVFFIIINLFVQLINYINWVRGVDQWFYYQTVDGLRYYNSTAGVIRATGTVVFFGFFGFLNMIAFFLLKFFYHGRYKNILLLLCLAMMFLSISYKTLIAFIIIISLYYYKSLYKFIPLLILSLIATILLIPNLVEKIIDDIILRFTLYISEGTSMRSESYRVMFYEIQNFNLFGKGIGMFGGPASIAYNSPYYQEIYFYWFDTAWLQLPTTDTYPPHVFVELGILGGIVYFFVLLIPLLKRTFDKRFIACIIIYFALFSDMLFSFSLNNLEFLLFSLVFIYPILYSQKHLYQKDE